MKIISKFKDYYDGLASHDATTGVYDRKCTAIPVDWIGYGHSIIGRFQEYELTTGLVGFCGKIYPYVKYSYHLKDKKTVSGFAYSYEDYMAVVEKVEDVKADRYRWFGGNDLFKGWRSLDNAKLWFEQDFKKLQDTEHHWGGNGKVREYPNPKDLFIKHKIPYFAIKHTGIKGEANTGYAIIMNPKLTDYGFHANFDAYSCYQEIEMFMNNQIVRPDDPYIEPVSDKVKAESHGFDKFSFRKDKCKPKRRKNK